MQSRNVVVIAGPSGSGESTVTNEIVQRFPKRAARLVTATTRQPRAGERNAIDYYFFTKEQFEEEKGKGHIPEFTYIKNRDTYYGSYLPDLMEKLEKGFIVIVNPDIVGAKYYKERFNAATIFIIPETVDILERRIRDRNPELSEDEIEKRKENARIEIENERPFYDYVVTNTDGQLDKTVSDIIAILTKEGYNLE